MKRSIRHTFYHKHSRYGTYNYAKKRLYRIKRKQYHRKRRQIEMPFIVTNIRVYKKVLRWYKNRVTIERLIFR